jgi:hypothetical protein
MLCGAILCRQLRKPFGGACDVIRREEWSDTSGECVVSKNKRDRNRFRKRTSQ